MPLELADAIAPPEGPDKDYLWTLNFGPQHPATHTTLRLILKLDGETVVKAVPDIGYLHSGFEKLGEDLDFNQYVTIVDRMNYISPVANEVAWHHAVEKLLGIELTPRCKYIRTIIAELTRISDHLLCIGAAALDLGGFTAFLYAFNQQREDLRHLRDGVGPALPSELHARRRPAVRRRRRRGSPRSAPSSGRSRRPTPTWSGCSTATASSSTAREASACCRRRTRSTSAAPGPIARASGVVRDLRKDEPYLAYTDFDFKVVCADGGDCLARYLVRMEEMLREPQDRPAGDREPAGRAGQRGRRQQGRSCPTSCRSIAASRA